MHERHPRIELIVTSGRRVYSDGGTFMAKPYGGERLIEVVKGKLASFARRNAAGA